MALANDSTNSPAVTVSARALGNPTSLAPISTPTVAPPAPQPAQIGAITGAVTYSPGDGAPIEIPQGPVEITRAFDSATLSWDAGDGVTGLTAMPNIQFNDYVSKGLITL